VKLLSKRWQPYFAFLCLCGIYLLAEKFRAGQISFVSDDAWIFAQFARNLANGFEFSYNPGEPVPGFSSALWVVLSAIAYKLTGQLVLPMKLMGILAGLGTIAVGLKIAQQWQTTDESEIAGWAVALSPLLVTAALSGMETSLWVFLVVLGFWWHVRFLAQPSPQWLLEGFIWGMAALTRPESLVFFALSALHKFLEHRQRSLLLLIGMGLLTVLLVFPWVAFNLKHTSTPFPATYLAKAEPSHIRFGALFTISVGIVLFTFWLAMNPIAFAAFVEAVKRKCDEKDWQAVFLLAVPLVFATIRLVVHRFPPMSIYFTRYFMPALVLALVFGLVWSKRWRKLPLWIIGAIPGLIWVANEHGWMVQNTTHMQVHIGKWLAQNTPPNAVIATNDIGAIAFFSKRRIVDTCGLVMPEILPFAYGKQPGTGIFGANEEGVWEFLKRRRVDYIVIFPNWYPRLSRRPELKPIYRVKLAHNVICGGDEMVVYQVKWESEGDEAGR
jgi:arabinofuranosyltransferase